MSEDLLRETSQVRDILDKDKKARLEERSCQDKEVNKLITIVQFRVALNIIKRFLENISFHHQILLQVQAIQNELCKQNDAIEKETASIRANVVTQLEKVALLSESMLSVYFNAVRDEPYLGGGEEYLTFSRCTVNSCLNKTR